MTSFFYGRVSTSKQDTSLSDQATRAKAYGAGRATPIEVPEDLCFTDPDTSGGTPFTQREGARRLMQTAERRPEVKHLIVTKLDRIGRDSLDGELTLRWLEERGITLHVIDLGGESISTAGHFGRLILRIIFAVAEWDRLNIRGNIRTAIRAKRERGEVIGKVPFGWTGVGTGRFRQRGEKRIEIRQMVEHEEEQRWLRFIVKARAPLAPCTGIEGPGWSYPEIERVLNQNGVPRRLAPETEDGEANSLEADPDHKGARHWSETGGAVHHILHNTFTAGVIEALREKPDADPNAEPEEPLLDDTDTEAAPAKAA